MEKRATLFYNPEKISCWLLVRISVVHHEPGPLRHLAQVPVRVVEILDRGQISLGGQAEGELKPRLVTKNTGKYRDVARLIKHSFPLQNTEIVRGVITCYSQQE